MDSISPEGCAAIATVMPVLLLTGLASDWNLERLRKSKTDLRVPTLVWLVAGLVVTFGALRGAATGEGIPETTTGVWLLIGVVMAYIPVSVAVRVYSDPRKDDQ